MDGSLKSIFSVTTPILLSSLSSNLMNITNRFMLANYSINAMNAAVIAGNFVSVLTFLFIGIAETAEVFVGQYTGAKDFDRIVTPVWQMIYMSVASVVIFVPIAYFSDYINLLPSYFSEEGIEYQKILLYFSSFSVAKSAVSSFFVGQGKAKVVTLVVIFGVFIDVGLGRLFIYGFRNIGSMGCKGAAFAIIISEIAQLVILLVIFFSSKNRKIYKTLENRIYDRKLFFKCVRMGLPISIGHFTGILAWLIVQTLVSHISKEVATVYNVSLTVFILFVFIGNGLCKSIAVISANMIGQGDILSIKTTYKIFIIISLVLGLIIAIPLAIFPKWVMGLFGLSQSVVLHLYDSVRVIFCLVIVNTMIEDILCCTWGVLISGGDTKFPMVIHQACVWMLVVVPTAILYHLGMLDSVIVVYVLITIYALTATLITYNRYINFSWYNKLI